MAMAYWNGISWECSPYEIAYLEGLTTSFSMDTENNADKEGKSPTEEIGLKPIEISFSTVYRVETGTADIQAVINMWKSMIGLSAPLIIGSEVFGPELSQLQSVGVSDIGLRHDGTMRAAKLTFKFKEFVEEPVTAENTSTTSAVKVGASKSEKSSLKYYHSVKG